MARISTIQTVSVINQPVDANERLTLIEKLEREYKKCCDEYYKVLMGGAKQAIDDESEVQDDDKI
jgi:hypothetical protein